MPDASRVAGGATWSVYLVRCADGSLYTGIATDVARRLDEHASDPSRAAKYLRGRAPLELVWHRAVGDRPFALRVEHRIKRLRRAAKEDLIAGASLEPVLAAARAALERASSG